MIPTRWRISGWWWSKTNRCFAHQKILVHLLFGVIYMTFYHGVHHHSIITIFELYPTIHHHPHKINMYKVGSPSQDAIVTTQNFYISTLRGDRNILCFPSNWCPMQTIGTVCPGPERPTCWIPLEATGTCDPRHPATYQGDKGEEWEFFFVSMSAVVAIAEWSLLLCRYYCENPCLEDEMCMFVGAKRLRECICLPHSSLQIRTLMDGSTLAIAGDIANTPGGATHRNTFDASTLLKATSRCQAPNPMAGDLRLV